MGFLSNAFALIADAFSGFEQKATIIFWFDDIDCPKELIK